jgi:hypothetical protein
MNGNTQEDATIRRSSVGELLAELERMKELVVCLVTPTQ